jgi:hypothetical protein
LLSGTMSGYFKPLSTVSNAEMFKNFPPLAGK